MPKERKDKHFVKKPIYQGGLRAMRDFISKHKKYPQEALEKKIEGSVYLKYSIDYKGKVTEAKVIKSVGFGCDEEAIRVVKLLRFQVPKNRGVRVKFYKNIHIHFRLPKQKSTKTQINYSLTTSKDKEKPQKKGKSYTIQINY